jgi:enediyne biosynthesis protein E3
VITGAGRGRLPVPPLPPAVVDFAGHRHRRGELTSRLLLQTRAFAFVEGYELRRRAGRTGIHEELARIGPENRGFAYEGAALAAALADLVVPCRARRRDGPGGRDSRLGNLLDGPGSGFVHLIHVGAGWSAAVLPWRVVHRRLSLDPLLRWLALDGGGFARGFFGGPRWIRRLADRPDREDSAQAVLRQGVGRSLWFVECGDVAGIRRQIERFPPGLRPELWAGVGLAVCYAGGCSDRQFEHLQALDGKERAALAQGAAFAAEAGRTAGHIPAHTEVAVAALAGVPAHTAANWARDSHDLARGLGPEVDSYRWWQREIRRRATAAAG